jgi:chromate transporter
VSDRPPPTEAVSFQLAPTPTLPEIAQGFLRYANFTLGGGSATVAVMHRELLERRRWIDSETFALCFALSRITPGTNLLAFCTGVGWTLRRAPGAWTALLASSIPCALIVILATAVFSQWQENYWAQTALHGAIAAAVAITARTCWTILHPHLKGRARPRVLGIACAAFALYVWLSIPAVEVLALAATLGALLPPPRA